MMRVSGRCDHKDGDSTTPSCRPDVVPPPGRSDLIQTEPIRAGPSRTGPSLAEPAGTGCFTVTRRPSVAVATDSAAAVRSSRGEQSRAGNDEPAESVNSTTSYLRTDATQQSALQTRTIVRRTARPKFGKPNNGVAVAVEVKRY